MDNGFCEYDLERLKTARDVLKAAYEHNYGHNPTRRYWKRLETIFYKLNDLIAIIETEDKQ